MKKVLFIIILLIIGCSILSASYMVNYIIVDGNDIDFFIGMVNMKILEGYIPLGGVAMIADESKTLYIQSMVTKDYYSYMNPLFLMDVTYVNHVQTN